MFRSRDKIAILATSEAGKTTLAKQIMDLYPRRITIDVLGEHYTPGSRTVFDFEGLAASLLDAERDQPENLDIVLQIDPGADDAALVVEAALVGAHRLGQMLVVVEESWEWQSANKISHGLKSLSFRGRHAEMAVLLTSLRPASLNKAFLSMCQHVFFGACHEKRDVDYYCDFLDLDRDQVRAIKQYEFIHFRRHQPLYVVDSRLTYRELYKKTALVTEPINNQPGDEPGKKTGVEKNEVPHTVENNTLRSGGTDPSKNVEGLPAQKSAAGAGN